MDVTLKVERREERGKGAAGRLRRAGRVPGVLYGDGKDPVALTVDPAGLREILGSATGPNTIFDLELAGSGQRRPVMIHALQRAPIGHAITHADFMRINMDRKVHVKVNISVKGTPIGVKMQGGILEFLHREVAIECLPGRIPDEIVVDVSALNVGQSIRVADLGIETAHVRLMEESDTVVVLVALPAAETSAAAEAEAAEPAAEPAKADE